MTIQDLAKLNASLNALSATLMIAGYTCIRLDWRKAHKRLMLTAVFTSVCFLTSYLIYHILGQPKHFEGVGWVWTAYYIMLISHVVLAVAIVPMVIITVYYGLRNRLAKHVRIARWTFWLWLYVSVTGVLVYFSLY